MQRHFIIFCIGSHAISIINILTYFHINKLFCCGRIYLFYLQEREMKASTSNCDLFCLAVNHLELLGVALHALVNCDLFCLAVNHLELLGVALHALVKLALS